MRTAHLVEKAEHFGVGSNDYDQPTALAVGSDGSTFITASFANTIDLDPGSEIVSHMSVGSYDTFLARYDGLSTAVPLTNAQHAPLTLAPNPVSNILAVHCGAACPFELLDATGQCLRRGYLHAGTTMVDMEAFAPGVYLLRTEAAAVRLVKEP